MHFLILKTNLDSDQGVDAIRPILNLHPSIIDWNIDTEDIDNVLRIEALQTIADLDIILLLNQFGVASETLNS